MDYTNISNEIVFLNDKNIVHALSDDSKTGKNAIPGHDLLVSCYDELKEYSETLCAKAVENANDYINERITTVTGNAEKTYVKLAGDQKITGSLSIETGLAVGTNTYVSVDNSIAIGHDAHANHHNSFVWNGKEKIENKNNSYSSHDDHTFNLNPANGLCGIYVGENTLCSLISEDIKLSTNAIVENAEKTYAQINDTYKISAVNEISAQLCSAVSSQNYVKEASVHFAYDSNDHALNLSVNDTILKVPTNQFEVGRFIHKVYLTADGDITYLAIQFKIEGDSDNSSEPVNTTPDKKDNDPESTDGTSTQSIDTYDAGTTFVDDNNGAKLQEIRININKLVQLYNAGQGISIISSASGYNVSINDDTYGKIQKIDGIQQYVDELSGGEDQSANPGIIRKISSDVDVLKIQNTRELKFDNVITIEASQLTGNTNKLSLSALIAESLGKGNDQVRNGSIFLVQYAANADSSLPYTTADDVKLGNNDFIIIRTLNVDQMYVALSSLSIDKEKCNVYITNAVHRYQYENLSSDLSNAVVSANTKIDKKIYIDGVSAESLCAQHIDADAFHELVVDGKLLYNVMYVVSSDYINAYDQRIENVKDPKDKQDAATKNYVDNVSVDLHNYTNSVSSDLSTALYKQLTAEEDARKGADSHLCSAIDNKISVGNYTSADGYKFTQSNLSVVTIDADDYHKMVAHKDGLDDNVVYILSSNYLNAYDQLVKNVKTPENDTDAANKKYVDDISVDISNAFADADEKLDDKIATKSNKISVDGNEIDALSVTHIKNEDFYKLVADGDLEASVMYIVSGDYVNAYDRQIKYVSDPEDDQDAATKHYVDANAASTVEIVKNVSSDIDTAVKNKVWVGSFYQTSNDVSATYHQDTTIENISVVNIGAEDYYKLVANDAENTSVVYIVSSDTINAYDQRIKHVAAPSVDTDAANKKYVDEHGTQYISDYLYRELSSDETLGKYITKGKIEDTDINDMTISALHRIAISIFNAVMEAHKK